MILKSATLLVATIAFLFGLQSCDSVKPIDKTKLEGYWTLKTLDGENADSIFEAENPGFKFDFSNNNVSGYAGCNTFVGEFTLTEANVFSAPNLVSTMKMCFQTNKEPQFLKALSTPGLTVSLDDKGELVFKNGETVVLQFVKGEEPVANEPVTINAESLTGKWNLTTIAGGDIATLFTEKKPTMEFAENNGVFGNAGCNNYRTVYELNEDTIKFKPVASTMMACPSMKGETLFTGLLTTPLLVAINEGKLILSKDGNVVLEFAKDTESK